MILSLITTNKLEKFSKQTDLFSFHLRPQPLPSVGGRKNVKKKKKEDKKEKNLQGDLPFPQFLLVPRSPD